MAWNIQIPTAEWVTSQTPNLEGIVREVADQKLCAIDTETTGLNYMTDFCLYWSLSWEVKDKPGLYKRACLRADALPAFSRIFADPSRDWPLANAKFDMHMLHNVGVNFAGRVLDTQVMHSLLFEELPHRLEYMATQLLGWQWKDDFKKGFKTEGPKNFLPRLEREELARLVEYASNDAYGTLHVYLWLKNELEKTRTHSLYPDKYGTLADYFYKIEAIFTKVLWKMERRGMFINEQYLHDADAPATAEINSIEREITHIVGRPINLKSNAQLIEYFFVEKGYPPLKMTKGGKTGKKMPCTDADVIEWLAEEHNDPVADRMLILRDLYRLKGTYIDGILGNLDQNTRVHTHFNQAIARTGRLSTSDIQFQNIPIAENDKFKIRRAFCAERGNVLLVADQEQLEMRLLAAATVSPEHPEGEKDMIQLFLDGKDIHMGNASLVFGIPYDDLVKAKKVDKEIKTGKRPESDMTEYLNRCLESRSAAKSIGFGLNYGMKESKLARQIKKSKDEAKLLIEQYMARYPAVANFYASAIADARQCGYSFTVLGRRRFHPEIVSSNKMERWGAERQAVNNEIQGTAADVLKMAMIAIDGADLDIELGCHMINQVHDELVFECHHSTVEEATEIVKDLMEHPLDRDFRVPLIASAGHGANWLDAK